jgi:hypothetical protein
MWFPDDLLLSTSLGLNRSFKPIMWETPFTFSRSTSNLKDASLVLKPVCVFIVWNKFLKYRGKLDIQQILISYSVKILNHYLLIQGNLIFAFIKVFFKKKVNGIFWSTRYKRLHIRDCGWFTPDPLQHKGPSIYKEAHEIEK